VDFIDDLLFLPRMNFFFWKFG